jgi:hypothetical protein
MFLFVSVYALVFTTLSAIWSWAYASLSASVSCSRTVCARVSATTRLEERAASTAIAAARKRQTKRIDPRSVPGCFISSFQESCGSWRSCRQETR